MSVPPTKRCITCGETKPLNEFHRRRASRDGHQSRCKACLIIAVAPSSRARSRAVSRLVAAHRAEYDQLYGTELAKETAPDHGPEDP